MYYKTASSLIQLEIYCDKLQDLTDANLEEMGILSPLVKQGYNV